MFQRDLMGIDGNCTTNLHVLNAKQSEQGICADQSTCVSLSDSCSSASSLQLLDSEIFELDDDSAAENETSYMAELEKIRKMIEDPAVFTYNDPKPLGKPQNNPHPCIQENLSSELHTENNNQDHDTPTAFTDQVRRRLIDEDDNSVCRDLENALDCIDFFVRTHKQDFHPSIIAGKIGKLAQGAGRLSSNRVKARVEEWIRIVQHWSNEGMKEQFHCHQESGMTTMGKHDKELAKVYNKLKSSEFEVNHCKMTIEDLLSGLASNDKRYDTKIGIEICDAIHSTGEHKCSSVDHLEALEDWKGDTIATSKNTMSTQQYFENTLEDMRQQVANERMQILYEKEKQQLDYDARSKELEEVHELSLQLLRSLLLREKLLKREEKAVDCSSQSTSRHRKSIEG